VPDLILGFGLVALVLVLSALASGVVERAPVSFPMIFLGAGVLLGEHGVGLLRVGLHDPALELIATLSLALVLFLDAVKLQVDEARRGWIVPALVLGPGTLLTIALVAGAGLLILGLPPAIAVLVGAILASTDPVVLRDVVRDRRIPGPVRRVLSIESGTNDVVVLPIVLALIALAQARLGGAGEWAAFLVRLLVVGPVVGFAVGGFGSWLMQAVDRRQPIRREYQALYGLGLVLAAFAAGQSIGGDGFLAAFAAGAAVVVLNQELCDCFMEYGETTAEMAMLLAFVLFGAVLSSSLSHVALGPALAFAAVAILVARPLAMLVVLRRAHLSGAARAFIAWFGPRGLSSLLLALLAVVGGVPGAEELFALVGLVVVVSVTLHGATATPLAAAYARLAAAATLPEERESSAAGLFEPDPDDVPRVTAEQLGARLASSDPPIVLDVRGEDQRERDRASIPGSLPVPLAEVVAWADQQADRRPVVAYCT
jgi:NhaP-type Na+/H+ or K+/H+ antiporter